MTLLVVSFVLLELSLGSADTCPDSIGTEGRCDGAVVAGATSVLSLAEQLQKRIEEELYAIKKAKAELNSERDSFEHEKAVMNKLPLESDQIVELNVGGEFITTHRSTLSSVQGSLLAGMFSGRWEEQLQKDKEGRYFLDHDPYCMRKIIDFLRSKKIQNPNDPIYLPIINEDKRVEFHRLIKYFGLVQIFSPQSSLHPDDLIAVATVNPHLLQSARSQQCLTLTYPGGPWGNFFARSQNPLKLGVVWKVKVISLPHQVSLFLGIISRLQPSLSFSDSTSFGWYWRSEDGSGYSVEAGIHEQEEGFRFSVGDTLRFRLEENSLLMSLERETESEIQSWFVLRNGQDVADVYVHINFESHVGPTSIVFQPVTAEDLAVA